MTVEQLQNAINRVQSHTPNQDRVTAQLLRSIDAVCKNMGHTNDAAKSARLKLFANTVRFGPFLEEHPQSDLRGVMNRLIYITPLVFKKTKK
jgi:hypothetical protein